MRAEVVFYFWMQPCGTEIFLVGIPKLAIRPPPQSLPDGDNDENTKSRLGAKHRTWTGRERVCLYSKCEGL